MGILSVEICLLLWVFTGVVFAKTVYVPTNYPTIQDAINALNDGDTIIVKDGTYRENVVVDKRLTIQSERGPNFTTVQAADPSNYTFKIVANYVNISGFSIKNATINVHNHIYDPNAGIYIDNAGWCNISDNIISNNYFGIKIYSIYSNNKISNNIIKNNEVGIFIFSFHYFSYNTVIGNIISTNKIGVEIQYSRGNTIVENTIIRNSDYGIYLLYPSSKNNIYRNDLINEGWDGFDDGEANQWYNDTLKAGNYYSIWSMFAPYTIPGSAGSIDKYPLTKPCTSEVPILTPTPTPIPILTPIPTPTVTPTTPSLTDSAKTAEEWYDEGVSLLELGEFEKSIKCFSKVIELYPGYVEAYLNRGSAYLNLGKFREAIKDLDKAIELNPKGAAAYYNRGLSYLMLDQHEKAIEDFDKAMELKPADVHIAANLYYYRGSAYLFLGKFREAIKDLDEAIELNPKEATAYYNRAMAYFGLGEYKKVIKNCNKAIEIDPNLNGAIELRNEAHKMLGEETSGFEAIFVIMGLLIIYLVKRGEK